MTLKFWIVCKNGSVMPERLNTILYNLSGYAKTRHRKLPKTLIAVFFILS
jgi:hypothetical protein